MLYRKLMLYWLYGGLVGITCSIVYDSPALFFATASVSIMLGGAVLITDSWSNDARDKDRSTYNDDE